MNDIVINPPRRLPPVIVEADAPAQVTTEIGRGRPGEPGPPGASDWAGITGKPATFPPEAHMQDFSTITATPTTLAGYGVTDAATALQGELAGTALQPASIGVTVQGYSAALAGTTASFTTADETKLDGVATGATANSPDATLLARANHTGTQAQSTVDGLVTDLAAKQAALVSGTNIKTVNGNSLLGSGDLVIAGGGGSTQVYVQDTDPGLTGPGIWIQTGLAPGGTGFTFWFEDGL